MMQKVQESQKTLDENIKVCQEHYERVVVTMPTEQIEKEIRRLTARIREKEREYVGCNSGSDPERKSAMSLLISVKH